MAIRAIGLEYIKLGDIEASGAMSTKLSQLGYTYQDTANLSQDDPQTTEFNVEELDDPIEEISTPGAKNITFGIIDMTPANMLKVMGGTVTGTAPNEEWHAPTTAPDIEQSVELKDKKSGKVMQFPRCKITAKFDWKLAKTGISVIQITAKVLRPTDGTTAPVIWKNAGS